MDIIINEVPIQFPFKPYQVQEDYMRKVIECLQDGKNGVLESPTGTGKTLSLLCSTLAWLLMKKAQIQIQAQTAGALDELSANTNFLHSFSNSLNKGGGKNFTQSKTFETLKPQIIYASRTHSQLSQAMQELKKTSYKHVNAIILGSRDQLCIHPDVLIEENSSNKILMCQLKLQEKRCKFYNNLDTMKLSVDQNILDIEDLVKSCKKIQVCPYFLSKSLKDDADIIFMPYNYLLDPKIRKNQGIELRNKIILLDEAHNIEKICEEAASLQFSSTDIAVCINEITDVMRKFADKLDGGEPSLDPTLDTALETAQKDFSAEDLCAYKAMFLELEKAIDSIEIQNREEGETFPGDYIFELLSKGDITESTSNSVIYKLDKIITYLTVLSTSINRKGRALQKFCDLLQIVFPTYATGCSKQKFREKIKKCYKVYIQIEQPKKSYKSNVWETKETTKSDGKLINFWCFSLAFRMQQILDEGVRCVILTSGTLAPLKPYISEIGIDIAVQLENPHIVTNKQICVGIISNGYDGFCLNSSYNTRNDPKYISSLGETIKILSSVLPHGLLVFFPSYPIMKNCQQQWQNGGKWTQIENYKPIYVEPQSKNGFNHVINEYYKKIKDPMQKGAILMGVCRGKVSEGLDFADSNGRAVLITGLPFPPLKDPRVMLKQRYLEENRQEGKESLTGQQWYQLEASRAVNQAIGRIIRHKNDYGAILLCDCRFDSQAFKQQLSSWIRPHIKKFHEFRGLVKELREFFKYAYANLPQPKCSFNVESDMYLPPVKAQFDCGSNCKSNCSVINSQIEIADADFDIDFYKIDNNKDSEKKTISNVNDFASLLEEKQDTVANLRTCKLQNISKFSQEFGTLSEPTAKRKKIKLKPVQFNIDEPTLSPSTSTSSVPVILPPKSSFVPVTSQPRLSSVPETSQPKSSFVSTISQSKLSSVPTTSQPNSNKTEKNLSEKQDSGKKYLKEVKKTLSQDNYNIFKNMIAKYPKSEISFDQLMTTLEKIFLTDHKSEHLFIGFRNYLKKNHLKAFDDYIKTIEVCSI